MISTLFEYIQPDNSVGYEIDCGVINEFPVNQSKNSRNVYPTDPKAYLSYSAGKRNK